MNVFLSRVARKLYIKAGILKQKADFYINGEEN